MVTRTRKTEILNPEKLETVSDLTISEEKIIEEAEIISEEIASEEHVRFSTFYTLEQWSSLYLYENPNDQFLIHAFKSIGSLNGPMYDTGRNWNDRFKAWGSSPA